jgi:general secretion pathway protein J
MRARGFSLLETLVASALFAVLAVLAWGGLDTIVRGRQVLVAEDAAWLDLARQVGRFERDLRQALARPVSAAGGEEPALDGSADGLGVTVWHPGNSTAVERVRWLCTEGRFRRQRRAAVDLSPPNLEDDAPGLVHAGCELHYFDAQGVRSPRWPPTQSDAARLPRAIELRLRIEGRGEYHRLLELPDAPAQVAP